MAPWLPTATPEQIRKVAHTFPVETGIGVDAVHPRAVAALSDLALRALARLYDALESELIIPEALRFVLVVFIPKEGAPGEKRPIGLITTITRIHGRFAALGV